jgi:DNA-binding beta-propeller fold protein YncE
LNPIYRSADPRLNVSNPVAPNKIAVLPDGSRAYVSSHSCNPGSFVYVIDMATLSLVGSPLVVGCFPSSIAVTPDGSQLWVSSRGDSRVDVFDTATNTNVIAYNIQLPTGIASTLLGPRHISAKVLVRATWL